MDVCTKCSKPVYPVEKVALFDKVYHKSCLTCTVCNCVLNIKTAKGYQKQPYCATHYPKLKATVTAEDPKVAAAQQAQSQVSNVAYKAKTTLSGAAEGQEQMKTSQEIKIMESASNVQDQTKQITPKRSSSIEKNEDKGGVPKYVCITTYEPQNDDELEVIENDMILVEEVFDDGWAMAFNTRSNKKGVVPFNYLEKY